MATDTLGGKLKQVRGEVKDGLGQLTDNDEAKLEGKRDKVVGAVQEKYGDAKTQAADGVNSLIDKFNDQPGAKQMVSQYPWQAILAALGGVLVLAFVIRTMRGD